MMQGTDREPGNTLGDLINNLDELIAVKAAAAKQDVGRVEMDWPDANWILGKDLMPGGDGKLAGGMTRSLCNQQRRSGIHSCPGTSEDIRKHPTPQAKDTEGRPARLLDDVLARWRADSTLSILPYHLSDRHGISTSRQHQ